MPTRHFGSPAPPGSLQDLQVRSRSIGATIPARIWSPAGAEGVALPLLVVHDGAAYDTQASLTGFSTAMITDGRLPPHRIALLDPGDRAEWYSASAAYSRALCRHVLPALHEAVPVAGRPVGMGASLGALAMLHAHRRWAGTFAGLFLQSGSFFVPRFDSHESAFARYQRIVRFVRSVVRAGPDADPIPIVLTCGREEENLNNNRLMAQALLSRGSSATLHEVAGGHDYTAWRDALDPHLAEMLAALWRR
jgi:enterochelin esterase family protein